MENLKEKIRKLVGQGMAARRYANVTTGLIMDEIKANPPALEFKEEKMSLEHVQVFVGRVFGHGYIIAIEKQSGEVVGVRVKRNQQPIFSADDVDGIPPLEELFEICRKDWKDIWEQGIKTLQ